MVRPKFYSNLELILYFPIRRSQSVMMQNSGTGWYEGLYLSGNKVRQQELECDGWLPGRLGIKWSGWEVPFKEVVADFNELLNFVFFCFLLRSKSFLFCIFAFHSKLFVAYRHGRHSKLYQYNSVSILIILFVAFNLWGVQAIPQIQNIIFCV